MERIPPEVMTKIFEYAALAGVEESQRCKICKRPFYWLLESKTSCAINLTCRRWRQIYLFRVLQLRRPVDGKSWCLTPADCLATEELRVWAYIRNTRIRFIPALPALDMEESDSTEEH